MADLKKSDCVTFEVATEQLKVARGTLRSYMAVLNVPAHKFPLDRRGYITKTDLVRIKKLLDENRS